MGYDVYITRREEWSDDGPPEITLEEWKSAASQFPDLVIPAGRDDSEDDRVFHDGGWGYIPFWYTHGNITVKKPTKRALMCMCEIAKMLNAKVVGDADEVYDEHGNPDRPTEYVPD